MHVLMHGFSSDNTHCVPKRVFIIVMTVSHFVAELRKVNFLIPKQLIFNQKLHLTDVSLYNIYLPVIASLSLLKKNDRMLITFYFVQIHNDRHMHLSFYASGIIIIIIKFPIGNEFKKFEYFEFPACV